MWKAFCVELNTINLEVRSIVKWWRDRRDLQRIHKNRLKIEKLNHKINVLIAQEKMYYSILHLFRVLTVGCRLQVGVLSNTVFPIT